MNYGILAALATLLLIGGGLYFYGMPERSAQPVADKKVEQPAPKPTRGFGIIDIEKIQASHPDGEQLAQLQATELRLRLELNEAMRLTQLPKPPPPETNTEVFDEAEWQKNAQAVISQLAELESRKKAALEDYRKKTEPRYLEERDKIIGEFLNENLNIQLKLKNADNLRLTDEQINELLKRLDEVEFERNRMQKELLDKWTAEIEQYAEDLVAEDEKRLRAEAERMRAEVEAQTRQKESDVTERNRRIMEDAVRAMENRQNRRRELLDELQAVGKERAALEKKILASIADKATMLAAVNRLEMVLIKRKPVPGNRILSRGVEQNFELKPPEGVGVAVFAGKNAKDLTDDLIREMKRL